MTDIILRVAGELTVKGGTGAIVEYHGKYFATVFDPGIIWTRIWNFSTRNYYTQWQKLLSNNHKMDPTITGVRYGTMATHSNLKLISWTSGATLNHITL